MKVKTTVHKYHRNDGTKVRQHKRNIDVDLWKKAEEMKEEGYDDSDIVEETGYHIDDDLIQSKEDKESDEMSEMENYMEPKISTKWKKIGKDQWDFNGMNLAIEPDGKEFVLMLFDYRNNKDILNKNFQTRHEALQFAENYTNKMS